MSDSLKMPTAIALAAFLSMASATSLFAESQDKSTGEAIGETSRKVADATEEGYEESKEWVEETSHEVAEDSKKGYETTKKESKDFIEEVEKGYNEKPE
jgi:F0F1-type ATP synthase membrane subunit b/b'